MYQKLLANGVSVLYDDRDEMTPGEKFADADFIGIPIRIVVSEKTIQENGIELKRRTEKKAEIITAHALFKMLDATKAK